MLPLTYAGGLYDRTLALRTGEIQPDGIQLQYQSPGIEEVFWRMMRHLSYDCSEMSMASYAITQDRGSHDMVAIPVFPSRHFRLSCIYVRADSPLTHLEQLAGKLVGVPEYQMTAAVWLRGILAEHFGVAAESMRWLTGRPERVEIALPPNVSLLPGDSGLAAALMAGDLDALMAARMPTEYVLNQGMRRLLPDSRSTEMAYFTKTGLFPIMHTVVVKGELYRKEPWVARSLYDAFVAAKDAALNAMCDSTALGTTLPWAVEELEETRRLLGHDFWAYGYKENAANVTTLLRYLHEQGLTSRRLATESLFVPEFIDG